mmetsp:Transcript_21709/g.71814  ORF Transcript_21709/g.71814 Transcript_21709/m.71814 type:complete len:719 (-) Transcript_21709:63-2219(-)
MPSVPSAAAMASWSAALLLAALYYWLALSASVHNAATFDEIAHIAGGMSMVTYRDFRLNPENGALPQMVAGVAMAAGGVRMAEVSDPSVYTGQAWLHSDGWEIGYQTLYHAGNEPSRVLLYGRAGVALFSFGTVLLAHAAAWQVYEGDAACALLSTLLTAFCPTLLAHGALVTSDGAFTFTALLASLSVSRMLDCIAPGAADKQAGEASAWRSLAWALVAGCSVGSVIVAKHSGVIMAPIALLLLLLKLPALCSRKILSRLLLLLLAVAVAVACSFLAVWGCYGFRFSAFNHLECRQWKSNWDAGLGSQHGKLEGIPQLLVQLAKKHKLLPEALLYGMSYAFLSTNARACFLAGEHGTAGWRFFFPYAMLVKTPSGVFLLLSLAVCMLILSSPGGDLRRFLRRMTPLLVLIFIYSLVAVNQNLNIGHRHMLPVYPPLYILCGLCGKLLRGWDSASAPRSLLLLLLLSIVAATMAVSAEVLSSFPYFIPFFNRLAGGPQLGFGHLVDSSLDWGQGLPALKTFMTEETERIRSNATSEQRPVFYVSYFGLGNPPSHGISSNSNFSVYHLHSSVSGVSRPRHIQEVNVLLFPGYFCIGASMLQPVYNSHAPGNWNAHYELVYRRQARFLIRLLTVSEHLRTQLVTGQVQVLHDMPKMLSWIDGFRLARLCSFFREMKPHAQPSYAFNVYKIDAKTLTRFLFGPAPPQTVDNDMTFLRLRLA